MIASLAEKLKNSIFGNFTSGDATRTHTQDQSERKRTLNDGVVKDESLAKKSRRDGPVITGMPIWLAESLSSIWGHRRSKGISHHGNGHPSTGVRQHDENKTTVGVDTNATKFNECIHANSFNSRPVPRLFHHQPYVDLDPDPPSCQQSRTTDSTVTRVMYDPSRYADPLVHPSRPARKRYTPDFRPRLYTTNEAPIAVSTAHHDSTPVDSRHPQKNLTAYDRMFTRCNKRQAAQPPPLLCSALRNQNNEKDKAEYRKLLRRIGGAQSCTAYQQRAEPSLKHPSSPTVIVIEDTRIVDPQSPTVVETTHPLPTPRPPVGSRDDDHRGAVWSRLGPPSHTRSHTRSHTGGRSETALRLHPKSSVMDLTKPPDTSRTSRSPSNTTHSTRFKPPPSHDSSNQSLPEFLVQDTEFVVNLKNKYQLPRHEKNKEICEAFTNLDIAQSKRKQLQKSDSYKKSREQILGSQRLSPPVAVLISSEEEDEEDVQIVDVLTPLSEDMEDQIDCALCPNPPNQILCEAFNIQITRRNMQSLYGLNWLNDEIINFYMHLLIERGGHNGYPRVHCFSTFFYEKLQTAGYAGVRRWTKKTDLFLCDLVVVPVHLGVHWCLAVIDMKENSISYYDSMYGDNPKCLHLLRQYLCQESLDKKKREFDLSGWMCECRKDIPEQMNGSDCGVFSCKYAEYITRNADVNFSQENMAYFRRRMVFEILTKRLL